MPRGRVIDKRLSRSQKYARLRHDRSCALYVLMYIHSDRDGKIVAEPHEIKVECCPFRKWSVRNIAESLVDLDAVGLIELYEVDNRLYAKFVAFEEFQPADRVEREAPSKLPDPQLGSTPHQVWHRVRDRFDIDLSRYELMVSGVLSSTKGIVFDARARMFVGITADDIDGWKKAYPACDIEIELLKMREWIISNWPRSRKQNWRRFITTWLSKQQDRGGTKGLQRKGDEELPPWLKAWAEKKEE